MQTGPQVAAQAVNEVAKRIDALAVKLGETAQQIFQIYVAQSRVEAIRDGMVCLVFLIFALFSGLVTRELFKLAKRTKDEEWVAAAVVMVAVTAAVFMVAVYWAYSSIGELLNPQYWAFQHLMSDIHGIL